MQLTKPHRQRLTGKALKKLYLQVVHRDEGLCQICGKIGQQAHHVLYGSKKEDCIENLLLVCGNCHAKVHAHLIAIEPYLRPEQLEYVEKKQRLNHINQPTGVF